MTMDLGPVGRNRPAGSLSIADMPVYPTTMWDLLEQRAAATPSQVLLDDDTGRTMTALQWRDAALTLAAALYVPNAPLR